MIILFIPLFLFALITKYENLKPYYLPNEPVNLTIKIILPKEENLTILTPPEYEYNLTKINPYIYKLYLNFKAKNAGTIYIIENNTTNELNLTLNIKNIQLPKNFSNLYSPYLKIENVISSSYDTQNNIVSFQIKAKNLKDFSLPYEENLTLTQKNEANFYAIVPKTKTSLTFYYYNTLENSFVKVRVPIIIKQDTISTQTNLNPEKGTFFTPFHIFLLGVISFFLILFLVYQRVWILIFPLLIGGYLIYKLLPKGEVILPPKTKVYILPTNSTPFLETNKYTKAKILNHVNGYTKIEINKKIGWVKDEDIK